MIKRLIILTLVIFTSTSCVSSKLYKELEGKYTNLKNDYDSLNADSESVLSDKNALQNQFDQLQNEYDATVLERNQLQQDVTALQKKYDALNDSYTALEQNSSKAIADNVQKNRELLAQLDAKEVALAAENNRLLKLEADMQERSQRIAELEALIASKDQAMRDLKDAISKALTAFEGKGLTVEQRDGKVYVSMENKLLFKSGSWAIGPEGRTAIEQLGTVLADNPDIAVLIEGHTDNDPFSSGGQIANNWDLSTKRATAIVQILNENEAINPESLTAAGRGEFAPIASNETTEGKAKNRRIEVVLTPKLDEITKLLNND
ncbi:OmpA family protein [Flavobacteriaceae bacterium]|jgi:chemotaxis protein MotB|nr:OmpA family protein [Flavobacteriaceae bacterium]MDB0003959.1 OmpA family protein [Flavobacteriaceae bacterium]MDG1309931.1 OmpA family protein [Flavobacteriaceae bacterium]|tara:strand:- start:11928 stop:12887 length:960 start_codon:yes stop_codon:yes gene_type:complete